MTEEYPKLHCILDPGDEIFDVKSGFKSGNRNRQHYVFYEVQKSILTSHCNEGNF
jgi:hypothetical protein